MLQKSQIVRKLTKSTVEYRCNQCAEIVVRDYYTALQSPVGGSCQTCLTALANLKEITSSSLAQLLHYCPLTGKLTHKVDQSRKRAGVDATSAHHLGYRVVYIGKKARLAHRIIWLMVTGEEPNQIDHIDHNRDNNTWTNLRSVSQLRNQMNLTKKINNTSGYTGIRVLPSGRFSAYIMVSRKQISLGTYDHLSDAVAARAAGEEKYGFHPNHGK